MLVNADGTQTLVATLNDDGEGPDLTAGDGIYSGTAVLNATEANNGIITLVASVAFPGESQNVISGPGTVQLFPPGVPLSMPPESVQSTCGPSGAEFHVLRTAPLYQPGQRLSGSFHLRWNRCGYGCGRVDISSREYLDDQIARRFYRSECVG